MNDYETNLQYFYELVERVQGNVRRMFVAIGITIVGLIAMLSSRPWSPSPSWRHVIAYLGLFIVSVGAIWFASRLIAENRKLEAEAEALANELGLDLDG